MNIMEAQAVLVATHVATIRQSDTGLASVDRCATMLLESGPGVGKSQSIRQMVERLCLILGEPVGFVVEMLATLTSADVRGFGLPVRDAVTGQVNMVFSTPPWFPSYDNTWVCAPDPDNAGRVVWYSPNASHNLWTAFNLGLNPSGPKWTDPANDNKPRPLPRVGVVFLDEWGQAQDEVKAPSAELLLNGGVGNTYLPPLWRVVAATNRMADRSAVLRELMFTVNRRCLLPITPDCDAWVHWATHQPAHLRPHHMLITYAQKHATLMFKDAVPDKPDPFGTPRSYVKMDYCLRSIRTQAEINQDILPTSKLARELCAGFIGDAEMNMFFTHMKFYDQIPDIKDIIADPTKATVPKEESAQMVCAYMLSHHVNDDTAAPIFTYVKRLSREMQIACIRATRGSGKSTDFADLRRAKAISSAPGFSEWLVENQDVLMAVSF